MNTVFRRMITEVYREEHPDPQWERKKRRSLNGEWEFDFGKITIDRELYRAENLKDKINVLFCP